MIIIIVVLVIIIIALLYILFMAGANPTYETHVIRQILFSLESKIPEEPEFGKSYWSGYRDALTDVERNINLNESEGN